MSTVGAVGRNDARSRACILCAHHPDILYLPFNNCFTGVCICVCVGIEGVASIGRQGESRGRWGGHLSLWDRDLFMFYSECVRVHKGMNSATYIHVSDNTCCTKMPPMLILNSLSD